MGREAVALAHWNGAVAEVRLHLDGKHLELRGDIRADLPRADLAGVRVVDDAVEMSVADAPLLLEFAKGEAAGWAKALLKTPPSLAQKLGVSADAPAYVLGDIRDEALATAVAGAVVDTPQAAAILLAIVMDDAAMREAERLAASAPEKHLWMICAKGQVAVGSTAIRGYLRGLGYRDSKSCAVSDTLTATRYRLVR